MLRVAFDRTTLEVLANDREAVLPLDAGKGPGVLRPARGGVPAKAGGPGSAIRIAA
jgi:hypothetical protein